jgi:sterol desaturase/sphingolipid hydroxylase (fatty acid hydroxylase superfamily)
VIDRLVFSRFNYWAGFGLDVTAAVALIAGGCAAADRAAPALAAVVAGAVIYSFYEYVLHRWIYHLVPGPVRRVHRLHHRDRALLIGSPFFYSLGICALSWAGAALVVGRALGAVVAGTILLGYASFSTVHALIHSVRALPAPLARLRRHHLHHHGHAAVNFGLLSTFWDRVFGTLAP